MKIKTFRYQPGHVQSETEVNECLADGYEIDYQEVHMTPDGVLYIVFVLKKHPQGDYRITADTIPATMGGTFTHP